MIPWKGITTIQKMVGSFCPRSPKTIQRSRSSPKTAFSSRDLFIIQNWGMVRWTSWEMAMIQIWLTFRMDLLIQTFRPILEVICARVNQLLKLDDDKPITKKMVKLVATGLWKNKSPSSPVGPVTIVINGVTEHL